MIEKGRKGYQTLQCFKCHGQAGRGDGPSAPTQKDANNWPIRPADLTQPWYFNGGGTVEDIYRRLRTGLDGTPMPSFSDALDAKVVSDEDLWGIAYYVRSLAPAGTPQPKEVIEAKKIEGEVPSSPDDSAWHAAERFWIPLVGQVIVKPRWFSPAVTGLWVQAVHNGTDLALRVEWDDRSNSPDTIWSQWRNRVTEIMEPKEGDAAASAAAAGPAAAAAAGAVAMAPPAPDALALWFPQRIPTGMERPYFFMGNTREPVYLWRWESRSAGGTAMNGQVTENLGKGPGRIDLLPGAGNKLTSQSKFDQGQWSVVFKRPLQAGDSTNSLTFATGQPIPVAFFAWDGDNGEHGTRGSLSTWYFVYLGQPAPRTLYATPLLATLLTAGLGLFAVGRAQRREREGGRKG